jgi:DNA modification methylase
MSGKATILQGNALDLQLEDSTVDLVVTSPPYFGQRSYQDGCPDCSAKDRNTMRGYMERYCPQCGEIRKRNKCPRCNITTLRTDAAKAAARKGASSNCRTCGGVSKGHYAGQIGAELLPVMFLDALIKATREMVRVLKPQGSIWINLGDKYLNKGLVGIPWRYAIRCMDELDLLLRAEVIWNKPNAQPESAKDRVKRSHEHWFHFVTSPDYFASLDALREYGRAWGSVWDITSQPLRIPADVGVGHYAAFPMEWPRRIVRGWSPDGGTVLDPFGGTGTTALVAKTLGRHGISVDLSADYCRIATWRVNDVQQLVKAGAS